MPPLRYLIFLLMDKHVTYALGRRGRRDKTQLVLAPTCKLGKSRGSNRSGSYSDSIMVAGPYPCTTSLPAMTRRLSAWLKRDLTARGPCVHVACGCPRRSPGPQPQPLLHQERWASECTSSMTEHMALGCKHKCKAKSRPTDIPQTH